MQRYKPYGIFLLVLICFSMESFANAEIYKWVDENGTLHFGDTPAQNMQPHVQSERMSPSSAYSRIESHVSKTGQSKSAIRKTQAGKRKPGVYTEADVELYTTSWCPSCKMAREFMQQHDIPFTEYDVEVDEEAAIRKQELDSRPGVPLAHINGQRILGFAPDAYMHALESGPQ